MDVIELVYFFFRTFISLDIFFLHSIYYPMNELMYPKKHTYTSEFTKLNSISLWWFVFYNFIFYNYLDYFFFSNEDIIVIVMLFFGDDMQYKPRFHSFIQQIVIEPFLPTRDYSRHLDYLNERTQTKIPVSLGGRET